MRILVSMPADDVTPVAALIGAALPDADVDTFRGSAMPNGHAADYVVTGYGDATIFDRERAMKAIFTLSAGVGHLLALPNLPHDVPVIRLEDAGMTGQMVRYVLASVLRFSQRFDVYAAQQRSRTWKQLAPRMPQALHAGVLGMGVIGGAIARALAARGFAVRGFSRTRRGIEGIRCHAGAGELDEFLQGLDVLVAILPLTPQSEGILDRRALERLADGAHVINIGRGGLIVEGDLLALLDSGKLSGATLDVFRDEPLPDDHPFWQRPAITVTPHIAGVTLPDEAVAQIADKIRRIEGGLPVSGIVDRQRGY